MCQFDAAAFLAIAGPALATAVLAQAPGPRIGAQARLWHRNSCRCPPNVKAEGLPPIPASIVQDLAPYASSRRAMAARLAPDAPRNPDHHGVRRQHVSDPFGRGTRNGSAAADILSDGRRRGGQHGQRAGMRRTASVPRVQQGLQQRGRNDAAVSFRPRHEEDRRCLTDGKSRNGVPVWSHRSRLIAFDSTRRSGTRRRRPRLWVMNPLDPSSARLVAEVEGKWSVADWSPDDSELLVVNSPAENTRTSLWRVNVKSGERTQLSPPRCIRRCGACPPYSPDGRSVYVLSNRDSETLRLWRGEARVGVVETDYRGNGRSRVVRAFPGRPNHRGGVRQHDQQPRRAPRRDARLKVRWAPKLPAGQVVASSARCGAPTAARWRSRSGRCERSATCFP